MHKDRALTFTEYAICLGNLPTLTRQRHARPSGQKRVGALPPDRTEGIATATPWIAPTLAKTCGAQWRQLSGDSQECRRPRGSNRSLPATAPATAARGDGGTKKKQRLGWIAALKVLRV